MSDIHSFLQGSGELPLADALAEIDKPVDRLRMAFAFVTESGVHLLQQGLRRALDSANPLELLISFDYGLSTPGGLLLLRDLPNSEVRIPSAEAVLENPGLRPISAFHPKLVWLMNEERHALWIGSANLTNGGFSKNREAVLAVSGLDPASRVIQNLDDWWNGQWDSALPLTDDLLTRYEETRPRAADRPMSSMWNDETPQPSELHEAEVFWTQVGYTQGGADNQMDVPARCGPFFFGAPVPFTVGYQETIVILHGGERFPNRKAKYHENDMTRLYLPTATRDRPLTDIPDLGEWFAIFQRVDPNTFELFLISPDVDSPLLNRLRQDSEILGQTDLAGERPLGWL